MTVFKLGMRDSNEMLCAGWLKVNMKFMLKIKICVLSLMAVAVTGHAQSVKADEKGLWDVWCGGTNSAFEASEMAKACKKFRTSAPQDPFTVVVSGLEAWNHLKKGDTGTATAIFNTMLVKGPATGLRKAGDEMARSWLSRLDRDQVTRALKDIYRRDIEFPASLEVFTALGDKAPPLTDRWGKPWVYKRGSAIKGMETQRYDLESSVLGMRSDLKGALKMGYAERIDIKAVRMVTGNKSVVEFKTGEGRSIFREEGDRGNIVNLIYVGSYIIVLSDGNHWSVMAKPR
ncbi:MAG: hypothetical protein WCP12_16695 [bacterium]